MGRSVIYELATSVRGTLRADGRVIDYDLASGEHTATEALRPVLEHLASLGLASAVAPAKRAAVKEG